MLANARDAKLEDTAVKAIVALSVMSGPVQAVLEGLAAPEFVETVKRELVLLVSAYLQAPR
jgi:hypothetical protein